MRDVAQALSDFLVALAKRTAPRERTSHLMSSVLSRAFDRLPSELRETVLSPAIKAVTEAGDASTAHEAAAHLEKDERATSAAPNVQAVPVGTNEGGQVHPIAEPLLPGDVVLLCVLPVTPGVSGVTASVGEPVRLRYRQRADSARRQ